MDPGFNWGRSDTRLREPPMTCSLVFVPLIHTALLYDREWVGTLSSWRGREGREFLSRMELCIQGWERVFPGMFQRWAQVIGRSTDEMVRRARETVGRGVEDMLRTADPGSSGERC